MYANGDARSALNAIELGILTTERSARRADPYHAGCGFRNVSRSALMRYDKNGDNHYDNDFRIYQKYAGV